MANGRQTVTQFNTNNEARLGTIASGQLQTLLTKISNTQTRKYLTGLRATVMPDSIDPVATYVDRFSRLIVCVGNLPDTDESSPLIMYPFASWQTLSSVQSVQGVNKLLLNTIVRNELTIMFDSPLIVYEGDVLSVLLGTAWAVGDGTATPSVSTCSLNVLGYEQMPNQPTFPFRME